MNYLYLRLSTNETKQQYSFEAQTAAIFAKYPELSTQKYEVVRDAMSGRYGIDRRPALASLLSRLCSGDVVYIYALDRLARETTLSGWLRYEIRFSGALLLSASENLGNDSQGRFIAAIMSANAERERDAIVSRIDGAISQKRRRGEKLGGHCPFGYAVDIRSGKKYLIPHPEEQKIIKKIIDEYARSGTYYAAAKNLSARRIYGRDEKPISRALIRKILIRINAPKNWEYTL